MNSFSIKSNLVDIFNQKIYPAEITVTDGKIEKIHPLPSEAPVENYILPGFIDAHVHVESSMLIPSEFARLAVIHGTVSTVSDPHEIANVVGVKGVDYMIENGKQVPFWFNFGAPSCVPATSFETAGASMNAETVTELLQRNEIKYLSEMMNWPGVLSGDAEVTKKIAAAHRLQKPVDGHAPGLKGEQALKYIEAGIHTDHECFTYEEALFKLQHGMKILIREGSAAKNFEALIPLLNDFPEQIMFCSDDKHPNDLVRGHINELVKRALAKGIDLFKVLRAACINPSLHYKLDHGLLRTGDSADFIVTDNLASFHILKTYIRGEIVAEKGKSRIQSVPSSVINNFNCNEKSADDFKIKATGKRIRVIEALDGQLITRTVLADVKEENGFAVTDIENDILKITVVNRYADAKPAVAFIKNFGLKEGAIASCVGHDSHNIIAVGTDDVSICRAVNLIIKEKGGLSAVSKKKEMVLPLPVAGIMANEDGYTVAEKYSAIDSFVKEMGTKLAAPFMTLSFMALLVIPQLKLSDKGLFDGEKFEFVNLFR